MIDCKLKILLIAFGLFTITSCGQNKTQKEMKWLTTETEYEGFPLYLRLPDYKNIWGFKDKYPNLFCITHKLDKVKNNGVPESDYNLSLIDFDGDLVNLFDNDKEGIIVLIETFGGERNYWYYISSEIDPISKVKNIKKKYPSNMIETDFRADSDWGFIKKYPIKLYDRK